MDRVVVDAPATSANLGPGFDVFALALDEPLDRVELSTEGAGRFAAEVELVGRPDVPAEPHANAAGAVALAIARKFKLKGALNIRLTKGVPIGVGLGSSGASSAAAAKAMDVMFGLKMSASELVASAGEGEKVVSGAAHLDNVAAAMMGGFVVVPRDSRSEPVKFDAPASMRIVVVTPIVKLPGRKTEYARSLLPGDVPLSAVVHNVSGASTMVAGFAKGDVDLIGKGMEDAVVEPARARIVPGLREARMVAKEAGAAGACMSGAGPSVLSLVDRDRADPQKVLRAVVASFKTRGVVATGFVTTAGKGARVVESP